MRDFDPLSRPDKPDHFPIKDMLGYSLCCFGMVVALGCSYYWEAERLEQQSLDREGSSERGGSRDRSNSERSCGTDSFDDGSVGQNVVWPRGQRSPTTEYGQLLHMGEQARGGVAGGHTASWGKPVAVAESPGAEKPVAVAESPGAEKPVTESRRGAESV